MIAIIRFCVYAVLYATAALSIIFLYCLIIGEVHRWKGKRK